LTTNLPFVREQDYLEKHSEYADNDGHDGINPDIGANLRMLLGRPRRFRYQWICGLRKMDSLGDFSDVPSESFNPFIFGFAFESSNNDLSTYWTSRIDFVVSACADLVGFHFDGFHFGGADGLPCAG
jgi:hypothetical protein